MSAIEPREFVDTNILIYAHDISAGPKHEQAKGLLEGLWEAGTGCLSIQVLQEFYVNVTRKITNPLSPLAAGQIISDLAEWDVHRPNASDVMEAIRLQTRHQLLFWDAMILTSAQRLGCQLVWSEDLSAGRQYGETTVRNPFVQS